MSLPSVSPNAFTSGASIVVLTMNSSPSDSSSKFPATSATVTTGVYSPSSSATPTVTVQVPSWPTCTGSSFVQSPTVTKTLAPGSAVPLITGLVLLVMLSSASAPVSLPASCFKPDVTSSGSVKSTVKGSPSTFSLSLPTASTKRATGVYSPSGRSAIVTDQ